MLAFTSMIHCSQQFLCLHVIVSGHVSYRALTLLNAAAEQNHLKSPLHMCMQFTLNIQT